MQIEHEGHVLRLGSFSQSDDARQIRITATVNLVAGRFGIDPETQAHQVHPLRLEQGQQILTSTIQLESATRILYRLQHGYIDTTHGYCTARYVLIGRSIITATAAATTAATAQ